MRSWPCPGCCRGRRSAEWKTTGQDRWAQTYSRAAAEGPGRYGCGLLLALSGSGHVQQRKEPPSMARPAEAQPTNRAGPNSYLQGVGRTPSGVAASPACLSPLQGSLPSALAEGGQGVRSRGWGPPKPQPLPIRPDECPSLCCPHPSMSSPHRVVTQAPRGLLCAPSGPFPHWASGGSM